MRPETMLSIIREISMTTDRLISACQRVNMLLREEEMSAIADREAFKEICDED